MTLTILRILASALIIAPFTVGNERARAADQTDVAVSALEFGGSIGKLLWVSVKEQQTSRPGGADAYKRLAEKVKSQIEIGRASAALVSGNFNVIATTLGYSAAVDPEPLSKAVAGVAAYGAKKAGDALSQAVLDQVGVQARAILAQGLKNVPPAEISSMTVSQLRARVADFQVGEMTIREILKDIPDALPILEAASVDLAEKLTIEGLAKSEAIGADVSKVRDNISQLTTNLADYRNAVQNHLGKIDTGLATLQQDSKVANQKLDELKKVLGNTAAIQSFASISYTGWSTKQKLQAVRSGMFPDLGPAKEAVIQSLEAQQKVERTVSALSSAAQDFGNLAQVASKLKLPKEVTTGLQGAQVVAGVVASFATGNYLGALAGATSLIGLGGPDAASQQHAQLMSYLQEAFKEINAKLDKIIELQKRTLEAIGNLAKALEEFRKDIVNRLDRLEGIVLSNQQLLQHLLLTQE
jgi:hypothetical protein